MRNEMGEPESRRRSKSVVPTDGPTMPLVDFPDASAEALGARSGDWFHRMQMAAIGVRPSQANDVKTPGAYCDDSFHRAQMAAIGIRPSRTNNVVIPKSDDIGG